MVLLQTTGIIICSGALEGQREGGAVGREAFSPDRKEVRIAHSAAQHKHRTAPHRGNPGVLEASTRNGWGGMNYNYSRSI